jgi:hypothetical protein
MAPEHASPDGLKRVALHLQTLSELTEALTYRLLELDERLTSSERTIHQLQGVGVGDPLSEDTELRLGDTEERLSRLEAILSIADAWSGESPQQEPDVVDEVLGADDDTSDPGSPVLPVAAESEPLIRIADPEPTFLDDLPTDESLPQQELQGDADGFEQEQGGVELELLEHHAQQDVDELHQLDQLDQLDQYEDRLIA